MSSKKLKKYRCQQQKGKEITLTDERLWFRYQYKMIDHIKGNNMACRPCTRGENETQEQSRDFYGILVSKILERLGRKVGRFHKKVEYLLF